jgi:hypothetical protein
MIKRLLILFIILSSQADFLFSQINEEISQKKNQFYVRSIINQINVGYLHSIIPAVSFSFECGYQFRYLSEFRYTGAIIPFNLVYQNLNAKKIIKDPGGSDDAPDTDYSEYSQRISEIIVQILFYKQNPDIPIQFYFGLGIRFQHLYNDYSMEGTVDHKEPSDRKEDYTITYYPMIIVGLKFQFAWF